MQSRGNAGIPLTTNTPFGYKKDPADENKWIVDEPAAEVVRQIFQMCISGLGPTQIAKRLKADAQRAPAQYWCELSDQTSRISAQVVFAHGGGNFGQAGVCG